jgi:hypothetical protein
MRATGTASAFALPTPPYVMLAASLPALGDLMAAKQTPISRLRLEQRLRGLAPADKALLDELLDLLAWRRLELDAGDAAQVRRANALVPRLPTAALRRAVEHRLEVRTILAALRRRRRGEPAPPAGLAWGYGRWTRTIRERWQEPGLGVERAHPWVREAASHVEAGDAVALEGLVMHEVWTMMGRLAAAHAFDFTAVALYTLRFQMVERRVAYDVEGASLRFRRLVAEGLAGFVEEAAP